FVVRGDTVTLHLTDAVEEPETLTGEGTVRLEFFGDELDALEVDGEPAEKYVLEPRTQEHLDRQEWTAKLLEKLPGAGYLAGPELCPGEASEAMAEWLWQHLAQRSTVSFGRDPLAASDEAPPMDALGYYRGKLSDFTADPHMWLKDGYSVQLLLKFERT